MTAKEAIEIMEGIAKNEYGFLSDDVVLAHRMAIEALKWPTWISCDERLPKESDGYVLVCMPDIFPYNSRQPFPDCNEVRRIDMAHYSKYNDQWYYSGGVSNDRPIAWAQLPESYEGE